MIEYTDIFSFKTFVDNFNECLSEDLPECFITINSSDCMAYIKIRNKEKSFYLLLYRSLICDKTFLEKNNDLEFSFEYSCFDMTDDSYTKNIFEVEFRIDKDCYFKKNCLDESYIECSKKLSDYINEQLNNSYSESNYKKHSKNTINELLKGRIGAVNATRKDAVKMIDSLNSYFNKNYEFIGFENKSKDDGFSIIGSFVYNEKEWDDKNKEYKYKKPQVYQVKIYETPWNKADKICIELTSNNKLVDITKGLILDSKKICQELDKLLKNNNIEKGDILSPKEFEKEKENKKRKEEKDRIEREKKQKRDSDLKKLRDYEDEKEKSRQQKMRKDWIDKHGDEYGFKSIERI